MRIQHNIAAMNSYRNYNINTGALSKNLEKLSSGYKINRAGDDAAGLAISEKMRAQISGLKQAQNNVKDGISLVKTAEGALQEVQDMLNRMTTLATQSANGTYDNAVDRANLQKEVTALATEIDRIADSSNFNGQKLLNGELENGATVKLDSVTISGTVNGQAIGSATKLSNNGFAAGDEVTINGVKYTYDAAADGSDGKTFKDFATLQTASGVKLAETAETSYTINGVAATFNGADSSAPAVGDTITAGNTTYIFEEDDQGANNWVTAKGQTAATDVANTTGYSYSGEITGKALTLQIGDTADKYNKLDVNVTDMHTKNLGIDTISVLNQDDAATAINKIKDAINTVSSTRGDLGAIQNRLEHTTNNLAVMTENIQDAESTIRDTDIADEMTTYTKNNILLQSAQAMLAQANQMPQGVLQLLQ